MSHRARKLKKLRRVYKRDRVFRGYIDAMVMIRKQEKIQGKPLMVTLPASLFEYQKASNLDQ